jgi:hypothetical protein
VPELLGLAPAAGYHALIWAYAATGLLLLLLFQRLSAAVEAPTTQTADDRTKRRLGVHRSRGVAAKLAALFALDSFAGGFVVQGLVAYWFSLRYGTDVATLGAIFFGTHLLSALSFLAAVPIARRIGLLNTMVFTHLPSNVLLMLVPLMPTLELAVVMLLARHLLSQLDVPTRARRAIRRGRVDLGRPQRRRGGRPGLRRPHPGRARPRAAVSGRGRAEDHLRPGDLRGFPWRATARGGGGAAVTRVTLRRESMK